MMGFVHKVKWAEGLEAQRNTLTLEAGINEIKTKTDLKYLTLDVIKLQYEKVSLEFKYEKMIEDILMFLLIF